MLARQRGDAPTLDRHQGRGASSPPNRAISDRTLGGLAGRLPCGLCLFGGWIATATVACAPPGCGYPCRVKEAGGHSETLGGCGGGHCVHGGSPLTRDASDGSGGGDPWRTHTSSLRPPRDADDSAAGRTRAIRMERAQHPDNRGRWQPLPTEGTPGQRAQRLADSRSASLSSRSLHQ